MYLARVYYGENNGAHIYSIYIVLDCCDKNWYSYQKITDNT